jgi:hypothetical protein
MLCIWETLTVGGYQPLDIYAADIDRTDRDIQLAHEQIRGDPGREAA